MFGVIVSRGLCCKIEKSLQVNIRYFNTNFGSLSHFCVASQKTLLVQFRNQWPNPSCLINWPKPQSSIKQCSIICNIRRSFFTKMFHKDPFYTDKVDKSQYDLVYISPATSYIFMGQLVASGLTTFFLLIKGFEITNFETAFLFTDYLENTTELTIACTAFVLLNLSVFAIIQKYPIRIYFNEEKEEFIIILFKILPFLTHKIKCQSGDMEHINSSSHTQFTGGYKLGKRKLIITPEYFKYPIYYNILLGYVQKEGHKDDT
ncbi:uncharacterized protein LOC106459526 isoform X2 [Limulus polyphemus]|nr:uncharacterized protein LOC106459526 isoform X2 [Limulus polyphemus]XP_022241737.1 uncharacterized protein LOC106459526 isoform X2 [Limulus polyphemus]XP_022241738.1 uncharacterized protein LOC106459526 isoform X2 [Limulus polyphemus]